MLQAVTHFYVVPGSILVNLSPYDTLTPYDFVHNYDLFCERRSLRISRLYEKTRC